MSREPYRHQGPRRLAGGLTLSAAVLLASGCGGAGRTNITPAVGKINALFAGAGIKLNCPKDVPSKSGTVFNCTLVGPTGKSRPVQMKLTGKNADTVDAADQKQLTQAAAAVR